MESREERVPAGLQAVREKKKGREDRDRSSMLNLSHKKKKKNPGRKPLAAVPGRPSRKGKKKKGEKNPTCQSLSTTSARRRQDKDEKGKDTARPTASPVPTGGKKKGRGKGGEARAFNIFGGGVNGQKGQGVRGSNAAREKKKKKGERRGNRPKQVNSFSVTSGVNIRQTKRGGENSRTAKRKR